MQPVNDSFLRVAIEWRYSAKAREVKGINISVLTKLIRKVLPYLTISAPTMNQHNRILELLGRLTGEISQGTGEHLSARLTNNGNPTH